MRTWADVVRAIERGIAKAVALMYGKRGKR